MSDWHVGGPGELAVYDSDGNRVAWLGWAKERGGSMRRTNQEQAEAASLVAAAPEMAEILSALVLYVDGHESRHCGPEECRCGFWAVLGKAKEALAKARGES